MTTFIALLMWICVAAVLEDRESKRRYKDAEEQPIEEPKASTDDTYSGAQIYEYAKYKDLPRHEPIRSQGRSKREIGKHKKPK